MKTKFNRFLSFLLVIVMLSSILSLSSCAFLEDFIGEGGKETPKLDPAPDPVNDNYRTFYQIFVGSFSDSNGDGIGDLRGIINRFDYLNDGDINNGDDLGVQGIWLSPIFSSPTYHKYDVMNYYKIDSKFGTMEDLQELIALCHERNVKIILDLVINHTSSQNEWFYKFKQARVNGDTENEYYDYYTCVTTEQRVGGRTYQKVGNSDFWYECNFSTAMPELNFDNPDVKDAVLDIAKYYIDMGIDGFRFDAVKYIYFGDTRSSVAFWEWYMGELEAYKPDIYCVGECWSDETEILTYYTAMNCFNFATAKGEGFVARTAKGSNISIFLNYIENFQDKVQEANPNGMPMSFLSNHDMDRIAGTFVEDSYMRMAANLYLLSPGSPFIYYGEEIGIKGSRGGAYTDANRRLAMLWGDGDTIKNPEGSTYKSDRQITTTVTSQLEDDGSLLNHYQALLSIRHRYPAIARGDYNAVVSKDLKNFGGFYIEYEGEILGLFHNTSAESITIDLSTMDGIDGHTFSEICDSLGGKVKLKGNTLTIAGFTTVILK